MYSKSEVVQSTLEYFRGDELATNVWIDKYCLKNNKEELLELTPKDTYKRLATEFARIENNYPNKLTYDEIFELLSNQIILPGGSLLYGIGNNYSISSLGNCFVIGNVADSYGGICTTDQEQVQLMKRRAGVGHDLSHLRPADAHVTNAAGSSTGPVSFMPRYSNSTREVAQDGRRGALMLSMDISHPDAEKFITAKDDLTKITGANISVKVGDGFMMSIFQDYIKTPRKEVFDNSDNKELWNKLVHQAWKSAEPGVLFWDTIISESPADCYEGFKSISTNPCGEIPLCAYDSCRLLSVNLTSFVDNPFTDDAVFNWERFKRTVYIAQKLMDDVVDLEEEKIKQILKKIEHDPEPQEIKQIEETLWRKILEKLLAGRRTGLSGIGLADTLAMLNISYSDGIRMAESIYKTLAIFAYKSSIDMAKDRGAFLVYDYLLEKSNPFLTRVMDEIYKENNPDYTSCKRRNIAVLTIPPSGSISLLAGISSGIEPVYQLFYKRRRKVDADHPNISFVDKNGDSWEEYEIYHKGYEDWLKLYQGQIKEWCPYEGSTAYELNPLDRVKMQGAIQKWVDHSISSTINLPKDAIEEDVSNIYIEAWKLGCKGITIYRDGCRDGVLVSNDTKSDVAFKNSDAPKRPKYVPCDIFNPTRHGQQYIVTVGIIDDKPYEVFAFKHDEKVKIDKGFLKKVNRGRYDLLDENREVILENITSEMSQIEEDRTRLISWGLRHGGGIKFLVEQLGKAKGNGFQSFSKVIARTLKKYIKDDDTVTGATCDNCGSTDLVYKDGCEQCNSCGSAKCG